MERTAQKYEMARIGDIDIHYHLADFTEPPRGKIVNLAGLDYGIHFLEPELCVNAVREFLAGQK